MSKSAARRAQGSRRTNVAWREAAADGQSSKFSWLLFTYVWENPAKGDHTIVSWAVDADGNVQPTEDEVPQKVTYWENPGQWPRTVRIG